MGSMKNRMWVRSIWLFSIAVVVFACEMIDDDEGRASRSSPVGTYQAEDGAVTNGSVHAEEPEYTGAGYVKPNDGGAVQWIDVSGGTAGGPHIIAIRYAHEGNVKDWELLVNGQSLGQLRPTATGRLSSWASHDWEVDLQPGSNTVRLKAIDYTAGPLFDRIDVYTRATN